MCPIAKVPARTGKKATVQDDHDPHNSGNDKKRSCLPHLRDRSVNRPAILHHNREEKSFSFSPISLDKRNGEENRASQTGVKNKSADYDKLRSSIRKRRIRSHGLCDYQFHDRWTSFLLRRICLQEMCQDTNSYPALRTRLSQPQDRFEFIVTVSFGYKSTVRRVPRDSASKEIRSRKAQKGENDPKKRNGREGKADEAVQLSWVQRKLEQ
nr:hypothetical protein CFP56_20550 [Quercus suber]